MLRERQICSRCILDSSIPDIVFDEEGECNYCKLHDISTKQQPLDETAQKRLNELVDEIKAKGKNKTYDCIVGVSGGADSTYTLYLAKKLGLRPLAVHFDNGWNTETSVSNIKNATDRLGIDLHTVVADWEEFKDLQTAFLKASTPDVEIPTDEAILAVLWRIAAKEGLHYVVHGHNFRTEGKIPIVWSYGDWRYIKNVYKKFGKNKKLKNYPRLSLLDYIYYCLIRRIKDIRLLNFIDYDEETVREILVKELGWQDYGLKHHESTYTRFSLAYYLPKKFNIDKRKIHFAALVRSGKISRDKALEEIRKPPISEEVAKEDVEYVIHKLGLTEEEFQQLLAAEPKTFLDYPTYYPLIKRLSTLIRWVYKLVSPSTPQLLLLGSETGKRPAKPAELLRKA
jgi:N-acetyl sugar amidotransferase